MKTIKTTGYLGKVSQLMPESRPNALDGLSSQTAKSKINRILSSLSKGIFSDDSWEGVRRIWQALDGAGIHYQIENTNYGNSSPDPANQMPNHKTWKFSVNFTNNKGKPTTLYGILTASGAGSVENPLERYDVVAYVS